ncbi:vacuolar protein sorting-associated protein 11 homolog isoform X2 [Homarus americanus]|uniref:vacuolar protein sorting-associated protein 11 homolog isoform X2 n=1 Tax=Homarus americanus TaxID=6706 RepID=UPI001C44E482|nr:vacuolar protein sorting-associated protein 11 homolog isoform X2 [Homarus americanus]
MVFWRRFGFFDVKANIDSGKLAEAVKDSDVTCTAAGRGHVYVGDSSGWVHSLTRQLKLESFQAHDRAVNSITTFDHASVIITVAEKSDGTSEIKVWAPDKPDVHGHPVCLRTLCPDPRPPHAGSRSSSVPQQAVKMPKVTAIAVHPNLSLMAVGFSDGAIMLYRGEVSRERGSKHRVLLTVSSGITSLHIRHTTRSTHLFVTSHTNIYCINCTVRDKETTVELDSVGCQPGCATLADGRHEHHLLVARPDAIYSYTSDSRGSCYVFEGEKSLVAWFRGYLIVAAADKGVPASRASERSITIYDLTNKLVALSTRVQGLAGAVGEWGGLYLVTTEPSLIHMSEKDLHSKFQLLFKKNQFDIAISLAKTQCCDQEEVAEILRQYGDWLYSKGNHPIAMDQYIKTIPHLEPSYVIRKYLDTQHINNLTTYLQALHKSGSATADHTSLLLNCYTRLRDTQQLDEFIMSKDGAVDCDVELGVRVCRSAGYYDHALALAAKHSLHHHHLAILIDDKKDYVAALRYISTLELEEAKANVLRYGSVLLSHVADETTELLIRLCTDYKPTNSPIIKEGSLDGYLTPEEPVYADPEDFEYMLVGHSEQAIMFLEKMATIPGKLSIKLYTTLLAEYLHQYSLAPEGQEQVALGEKVMELLRSSDNEYCRDHALLLCDKHKFHDGKLLLWEQAGMYEELLAWYAELGDMDSMLAVCFRKSQQQPRLWCSALKLLTSESSLTPPDPQHLMNCLNNIEQKGLLPPLEVVDQLATSPHISLGQVREYLLRVVSTHSATLASETTRTQQYSEETARMRETIRELRTSATPFTATKCNICNNELELPSVHFLCRHSFHQHCFESYSESDSECPVCLPENKKMLEVIRAQCYGVILPLQETHRSQHDQFHEQLERSTDSFSVVADYLGRGVFTHLHSLAAMYPPLNTTKNQSKVVPKAAAATNVGQDVADSGSEARIRTTEFRPKLSKGLVVPEPEGRLRALERVSQEPVGVGGEGRLRMSERHGQGVMKSEPEGRLRTEGRGGIAKFPSDGTSKAMNAPAEGRVRQENPSDILTSPTEGRLRSGITSSMAVPTAESRIRANEAKRMGGGAGKFSPSLHDHITGSPTPALDRDLKKTSPVESISTALTGTHISRPKTLTDNPFQEDNASVSNPFGDDFETEHMENNPFAEEYDESKNPFAEDSPRNMTPGDINPFAKDDYESQLNPFG